MNTKKKKFTITITRQFGSLGRPIARKLSEILDIEYYDRDIVETCAERLNLPVSTVDDREETAKSVKRNAFFNMMFPLGKGTNEVQDRIFEAQQNIIKFLAEKEPCIIVGRCSDFALQDSQNATHIYIYSSYDHRLQNCVKNLNLDEEEAKKMIEAVDLARDSYHMNYAGYHPYDTDHKDMMIDSSYLGVTETAEYLAKLIQKKYEL